MGYVNDRSLINGVCENENPAQYCHSDDMDGVGMNIDENEFEIKMAQIPVLSISLFRCIFFENP
jgi:hypothetical protein